MTAPRVALLTAVRDPGSPAFSDTVRSVLAQDLSDWQWVIVDAGPSTGDPAPSNRTLSELAGSEPRVTLHREASAEHSAALHDALERAEGDYVAVLAEGDVLTPDALSSVVTAIDLAGTDRGTGEVDYCYTDHDLIRADGTTHSPHRKPAWSPERLRHGMYTAHLSLLRRELAVAVGGFGTGHGADEEYDLVLRVTERGGEILHVPRVLHHRREAGRTGTGDPAGAGGAGGVRAVQEHLDRLGIAATVSPGDLDGLHVVRREPDLHTPVSIVIPTRGTRARVWADERLMVRETIRSVRERSAHHAVQFVVVHDRETPDAALAELRELAVTDRLDLVLVEYAKPFNFSEKCNLGALHAAHDTLIFLNDDMEASTEGLIENLITPLAEPGVGCTGPRLLFEDLRIQHAGVSYGDGGIRHMYYREGPTAPGVRGELRMNREVSALTGACVAMRRSTFLEVGGFSEEFPVNFNDVDLSLKIRRLGLRNIWLWEDTMFHFESVTRDKKVEVEERRRIVRRWGNLDVAREAYSNDAR